ncbi:MAG: hypothetical protein EHM85_02360 [Desulfobacteraceae bacterium]|nr:MAG: hypothetical protein EHM85_02360 [Desulfobacteraceae bacterium]
MKILVVGDGHSEIHEVAVAEAFRKLGHQVEVFFWRSYFCARNVIVRQWQRGQNKFIRGPQIYRLNRDLAAKAYHLKPDMIFIYRGTHITASTISKIKHNIPRCQIVGYNNDDPFAPGHPPWLWQKFMSSLSMYDLIFAYRRHNVEDFRRAGAKRVALLMPWFIPEKNHPVSINEIQENRFLYDVVFIGHYENDHRLTYIKILSDNEFDLKLFGPDWDRVSRHPWLTKFLPINPVRGDDYNLALCSARIALCFFSKLNRDTYTRRCFEIPATGTFMLSEYSNDMANLFTEGKEADFFRSPEEMIMKIDKYINDDALRTSIAEAGLRRVHQDGHDVVSRMQLVLKHMSSLNV